jgi:release factor glutamine methyltransferase
VKTVLEVITATADYFAKNKVESPRLNIEHLLAHVLGMKRMGLYMAFDRVLSEAELTPLRALVKRRAAGEPLQHLMGSAEFLAQTLKCDARALIPRPETEELVEFLQREGKTEECRWKVGHIVDVGTGSGCIALALASAFPEAKITAVDMSDDALALAAENAKTLGFSERITFLKSDLLSAVDGPIDLLVANLPYIPSDEIPGLQREVLREPHMALDGGADGLVLVRRLLSEAKDQPSRLAGELSGYAEVSTAKDYSDRERFLYLRS